MCTVSHLITARDGTKFAFELDDVRTLNVFSRFEIQRIFFMSHRQIQISGLSASHVYTDWPPEQTSNKCTLPNSLKGLKIIPNMADRYVSKDDNSPFWILGSALTYLLCSVNESRKQ